MFASFLAWWLRQLAGLLPAAWRPGSLGGAAADDVSDCMMLLLPAGAPGQAGDAVEAARRRRRRLLRLGRYRLDPAGLAALRAAIGTGRHGPVRLLLPPTLLLEQPVTLPLAAERGLETALRWEMDRLTPFSADAVFWSWRVVERDRVRSRLDLRLVLVAKASVRSALEALATAGLAPSRFEAAGDPARAIVLDGPRRSGPRRPVLLAGGALCAGLALAAIAIPFWQQGAELDRLNARVAELRPEVDAAEALRRQVASRTASTEVVAAEAARVGDALHVLAILTDLLPDDTMLYDLSLRDRVLTFGGQSTGAARLISILAADPQVRNPVFSAPVTRNEVARTESFAIRAEMRP